MAWILNFPQGPPKKEPLSFSKSFNNYMGIKKLESEKPADIWTVIKVFKLDFNF